MHFFDGLQHVGHADADRYARYFPRPPGALSGEWTPEYMFHPTTPALLSAVAPEAKLLVILRDPVERFISGLAFSSWWRRHDVVPPNKQAQVDHSRKRGLYCSQLTNLLRHFRRDRLLVLQYEHCAADPHRELRRTFDFLGLDQRMARPDVSKRVHATAGFGVEPVQLSPADRAALVTYYEPDVRSLVATFPEIDLTLWPNFAHLA